MRNCELTRLKPSRTPLFKLVSTATCSMCANSSICRLGGGCGYGSKARAGRARCTHLDLSLPR
jgi:hypothetical protein